MRDLLPRIVKCVVMDLRYSYTSWRLSAKAERLEMWYVAREVSWVEGDGGDGGVLVYVISGQLTNSFV